MQKIIKKYSNQMMWVSLGLILVGFCFKPIHKPLFLLSTILCGFPIFYKGYAGLKYKAIGIEVLVSIAVTGALFIGELHEACIVTFLFQLGNYLEEKTIKKTRNAIRLLSDLAPMSATLLSGEQVDVDEVQIGDLLICKTGSMVGVDGIISQGEGYFNESSITGEFDLKYKSVGDMIYAGSLVEDGMAIMKATSISEDSTFSKIIALVEEAEDTKTPIEKWINRFSQWYTPFVIVLALVIFLLTQNLDTALTALVLACPGALVIGAPIASVAGIGKGAKNHILYKGGDVISSFSEVDTFIFDKTGTLTKGKCKVSHVTYFDDQDEANYIGMLLEKNANHPLGKAICEYLNLEVEDVEVKVEKGLGVSYQNYYCGSKAFMEKKGVCLDGYCPSIYSTVLVAKDKKLLAQFEIEDEIREDASLLIQELKKNHCQVMILSGDHQKAVDKLASQLEINHAIGHLLPEDKLKIVRETMNEGKKVAFIGDGINDSPSLTQANIGIAMGSGCDVAIETSDVVLVSSSLSSLLEAYKLSKRIMMILTENIAIALITVILLLFGLLLGYIHMGIGMFIHEASILLVIINASRLLGGKNNG